MSKLRTLSCKEWRYLLSGLLLPPIIRIAIHFWGFRRVYAWLWRNSPLPAADTPSSFDNAEITSLARLINSAAHRCPVYASCLHRSLALWWLLRRGGVSSNLRIGVNKHNCEFSAHAWLEKDGIVLNDSQSNIQLFAPFHQVIDPATSDML